MRPGAPSRATNQTEWSYSETGIPSKLQQARRLTGPRIRRRHASLHESHSTSQIGEKLTSDRSSAAKAQASVTNGCKRREPCSTRPFGFLPRASAPFNSDHGYAARRPGLVWKRDGSGEDAGDHIGILAATTLSAGQYLVWMSTSWVDHSGVHSAMMFISRGALPEMCRQRAGNGEYRYECRD